VRPKPPVIARIERALGSRTLGFTRVQRGYTPVERWIVSLPGDARAFAKVGVDEDTAAWLRQEADVYARVAAGRRSRFMPRLLAYDDDALEAILLLEDLSRAEWPPPWSEAGVASVRQALAEMHAHPSPLPPLSEQLPSWDAIYGWERVASDPEPFLTLGLAGAHWLEAALPELTRAEARVELEGDALCHFDVRSDNLCLREGGAVLVDWNRACTGPAALDLGFWLPSLAAEGGPAPETLLPDAPEIAAFVAGFFACRAGLTGIERAPKVREVQRVQLRTALPWAARALGLIPPG